MKGVSRRKRRSRQCAGYTLVEVIIAMTLLSAVLIILATLSTSITRRGRLNELTTKRNLALAQQASRVQTMPWDDVVILTSGTAQLLVGDFTFTRRLVVTSAGANRRIIRVVVAPVVAEFRPDSVTIERTRPASGMPLCSTC